MSIKQWLKTWRFSLVSAGLMVLPALLIWHLSYLQVMPNQQRGFEFLQEEGAARTLRSETLSAYRGVITDRNGELLAVSTPVKAIYANPQLISNHQIPALAKSLDVTEASLNKKLNLYKNKQFVYLARHIKPSKADSILSNKFSGVFAETEYRRFYPAGEFAAHVVGFTDIDDRGQEGVELALDHWLAGSEGKKKVIKDLKGNIVKDLGLLEAPKAGGDVQLTLDLKLQYLAYRELKKSIAELGAKSGSIVLLDVKTSEILAMVNQPSYNPNDRSGVSPDQLRNRVVTDLFEPGSTVKPFTIIAALESGRYSPEREIDTSPGHVRVTGKTFLDPVNYGVMDLTKILQKSSQVGITKIALDLEPQNILDTFSRVGFGESSGIAFPGESSGLLPARTRWSDIERATFAFGYGLNVNVLQLAQAYSVIANKGLYTPLTLIRNTESPEPTRVVSKKIASQVTEMLKTVTQRGGTATHANISDFPVAGKTGTAHKVGAGGYIDDKYVALFAGFAPADDPKVVAVVIVNEPPASGGYHGGTAAAPIFSRVVGQALKKLNVSPVNTEHYLVRAGEY